MGTRAFVTLLLYGSVLGCGGASRVDSAGDSAVSDTSSDTGGDDTASDTGGADTGHDTASGPCGIDHFAIRLEVLDSDGVAGDVFSSSEPLTLVGTVRNTCPFSVSFETPTECLFEVWDLSSEEAFAEPVWCDAVPRSWTIEAGETEDMRVRQGALVPATWRWRVHFLGGQRVERVFTVE